MAILGYARVSTQNQDLRGQIEAFEGRGDDHDLPRESQRRSADRPQLAKLMAALKPGDIVTVTATDHGARHTR